MSNSIKGLTVEINGDTQPLTSAINKLDNPLKNSKKELKEIDRLLKLDPGNTDLLAQRQEVLAQATQQAKAKVDALKAAEQQAQAQFARGDIGEEQMRALQRAVIKAESELKDLEKQAKETGEETKDGADKGKKGLEKMGKEGKEAGEDVEKGGKKGKEGLDKTSDAAAKAENKLQGLKAAGQVVGTALAAGFTAAATAAGAMVKFLGDATAEAGEYADTILTEAKVTGMSTEQLQAYHYAAEQLDTSLETVTRSQTKNLKSMQSAAKGTGDAYEAYTKLGISVTDADGKLRDANTVYWEAIDALGKIEDETERDALGMTIFGKSAKELNPLIEAGSEGLARLTEEAHQMGAVMSDETLEELANFDDSMQQLKSGGEALKHQLGTVLLPEFQGLADSMSSILGEMTTGIEEADGDWDKITEVIENGADKACAALAEYVPRIVEIVGNLVLSAANALIEEMPAIFSALEKIAGKLLEMAPKFVEAAVELIQKLVQGIAKNAGKIVAAGKDIVFSLLKGVKSLIPDVIKAASSLVSELIKQLLNPETLAELFQVGVETIGAVVEGLVYGIADIGAAIFGLFEPVEKLSDATIEKAKKAADAVTPLVDAIKNAVATVDPNKLLDAYGRTTDDIAKIIDDKEGEIRDILAERLGEQQTLRDEDLEHIRAYLNDLDDLENNKLSIYQSGQKAELRKITLDNDVTQDEAARVLANAGAALENTITALDDSFTNRLTRVENLYTSGYYATDEEYQAALEAEQQWYEEQYNAAQDLYKQTVAAAQEALKPAAEEAAGAFRTLSQTADLGINEYIAGLSDLDLDAANAFLTASAMRVANGETLDEDTATILHDFISAFSGESDEFDEAARSMFDSMVSGLEEYFPTLKKAGDMTTDEVVTQLLYNLLPEIYHPSGTEPKYATFGNVAGYIVDANQNAIAGGKKDDDFHTGSSGVQHGGRSFGTAEEESERNGGGGIVGSVMHNKSYGHLMDIAAAYFENQQGESDTLIDTMNDTAEATKTGNRTLDSILAAVNGLNLTLVLDDGTVIARTIGRIDAGLGERSKNDQRGSFD